MAQENDSNISSNMVLDEMLDSFEHPCWMMLDGKNIGYVLDEI